uniref:G-protein coupled receptors family 2 profile 2 domain-containing protein n=1 Tax=Sphaeramia orbicularis TaxID=375764 RepID=A0A672YT89_9TELE
MFVNVNFFYTKTKRTFDVVYFWTILFLFDWSGPCSRVSEQGLVCPAVSLSVVGGTFRRGVWSAFLGVGFVRSLSRSSKLCLSSGSVSRSCTEDGWSDVQPAYEDACTAVKGSVLLLSWLHLLKPLSRLLRQVYTAGYATSLASLISAIFVFAAFRKFHCTRNYIHINLFLSFILRASAVFIKDRVLFSDEDLDHCFMSTPSCKAAVAFFHFSILANYFWLLVEGLYLQTLLALTFVFHNKFFWCYLLIGWGGYTFCLVGTRSVRCLRSVCWDDTDVSFIWWIIKAPITASLLVNFIIFINVIRILVQKLRSPAVGGNDTGHFKRLAKSTLLLIPLFGMHYMVFAFLPENTGTDARIFIELGLGSFQGFVVALLYCFLNGEVSGSQLHNNYTTTTQQQLYNSLSHSDIKQSNGSCRKELLLRSVLDWGGGVSVCG